MPIFDNIRLLELLSVPSLVLLVLLAILTMRSVIMRDRAMTFGKTAEAEARRVRYEQRWRSTITAA